jgi:hypothetical protein
MIDAISASIDKRAARQNGQQPRGGFVGRVEATKPLREQRTMPSRADRVDVPALGRLASQRWNNAVSMWEPFLSVNRAKRRSSRSSVRRS